MGCDFRYLEYLDEKGVFAKKKNTKVLDIGTQNLYLADKLAVIKFLQKNNASLTGDKLEAFAKKIADGSGYVEGTKGFKNGAFLGEIFSSIGIDYLAFDLFKGPSTEVFDLNEYNLPLEHHKKFDVVLNFGTTEHVLNQYNAFKVIHDATAMDGYVFHQLPATGYIDHGYFMYSPKFFFELAALNNYDLLDVWFSGPQSYSNVFDTLKDKEKLVRDPNKPHNDVPSWDKSPIPNAVINVLFKKTNNNDFKVALELSTSIGAVDKHVNMWYTGNKKNIPQEIIERYSFNKELIRFTSTKNLIKIVLKRIANKMSLA